MDSLDKTIKFYDDYAEEYAKNIKDFLPKCELDRFSIYMPLDDRKVLDAGCGSGIAARYLQEKGFNVTGIDLSESQLKIAKLNSQDSQFEKMDIKKITFPKETFAGVISIGSVLHLEKKDVPLALNGFWDVLKKSGILYLSVKEGAGEGIEKDDRYNGAEKYYSYFTREEMTSILKSEKFGVLVSPMNESQDKYRNEHPWMNFIAIKKSGSF